MQIVRTILWVLLFVVLLLFTANNWQSVEVKIWEGLILETKKPVLVIVAFLAGLLPMWLLHRGNSWRLHRRINTLESAARVAAMSPDPHPETGDPATDPAAIDHRDKSDNL